MNLFGLSKLSKNIFWASYDHVVAQKLIFWTKMSKKVVKTLSPHPVSYLRDIFAYGPGQKGGGDRQSLKAKKSLKIRISLVSPKWMFCRPNQVSCRSIWGRWTRWKHFQRHLRHIWGSSVFQRRHVAWFWRNFMYSEQLEMRMSKRRLACNFGRYTAIIAIFYDLRIVRPWFDVR